MLVITTIAIGQNLDDPLKYIEQWDVVQLDDFYLDCTRYKTHIYDDFLETELDTTVWSTSRSGGKYGCPIDKSPIHHYEFVRWKNNPEKIGVYYPDNVQVSNGTVKLWSKKQATVVDGVAYGHTLGMLRTRRANRTKDSDGNRLPDACIIKNSKDNYLSFGRISARVRMSDDNGLATAIWTWTPSGEIDLFDNGRKKYVEQCLFKHPEWKKCKKLKDHNYAEDFHIYRVDYSPYKIEWTVDNVTTHIQYKYYDMNNEPYLPECGQMNPGGLFKMNPLFPYKDDWYPLITWVYRINNVTSDEYSEMDWIIYERKSYQIPELTKSIAEEGCRISYSLFDGLMNFGHFKWEHYNYSIKSVNPHFKDIDIQIMDSTRLCINYKDGIDARLGVGVAVGDVTIVNEKTQIEFTYPIKFLEVSGRP